MSFAYPQPPTPASHCAPSCSCANLACQIRKLECELQKLKQRVAECCDDQPTPEEVVCDVFGDASAGVPASDATALYKNADNTFTASTPTETQCSVFNGASAGVPADQNATVLYKNTDNTFVKTTSEQVFCSMVNAAAPLALTNPFNTEILLKETVPQLLFKSTPCEIINGYIRTVPFMSFADVNSTNPQNMIFPVLDQTNLDVCQKMSFVQLLNNLTSSAVTDCNPTNVTAPNLFFTVFNGNTLQACKITLADLKTFINAP